ncbi:MAG: alpha/beta hydrolase [Anaerolineae bacterium]|nr:alpha/beta hydrolase [Anaerolineae bacterium]
MKNKHPKRRRLIRIIGLFVILLIIALYIGIPSIMAVSAIVPDHSSAGEPPQGFSEITVLTDDGVALAGWYAEPENGAVIIVVHGAGSGRNSVRSHAMMLHENGFGVLALNMRGYGDSEGDINRLGWTGTRDISAAIDFLSKRDEVEAIGGLGLSMGGEILLGAASSYPAMQAIAAEGATHRCLEEYTALPKNRPLYRNFTHRVFTLMVGLFSGKAPPEPPLLNSIEQAETTAFLFIAAGNEGEEIDYNTLFHDAVRDHSSLWIIPEVGHTNGLGGVPDLYESRIIEFFRAELLRGLE